MMQPKMEVDSNIVPTAVDLLIFDLDGTLADTSQDLTNAVNYALRKLGRKEHDVKTIQKYVGDGVRKLLERAMNSSTESAIEESLIYFGEFYSSHVSDFTTAYPGIKDVLIHYSKKKKAVLTNKATNFTEPLLEALGIREHFDVVIGGSSEFNKKPDPQAVFALLEQFNVSPNRAVIIGDSKNDILAGKGARIYTCAVSYGFAKDTELRSMQPDFMVDEPPKLLSLFK